MSSRWVGCALCGAWAALPLPPALCCQVWGHLISFPTWPLLPALDRSFWDFLSKFRKVAKWCLGVSLYRSSHSSRWVHSGPLRPLVPEEFHTHIFLGNYFLFLFFVLFLLERLLVECWAFLEWASTLLLFMFYLFVLLCDGLCFFYYTLFPGVFPSSSTPFLNSIFSWV